MNTERGFSLLELMVALVIFATLTASVQMAMQLVLRQNLRVQESLLAGWVLDNHLVERRVSGGRMPGQSQYEVSMGARAWRLTEVLNAAEPGLLVIELAVYATDRPDRVYGITSRVLADD